MKILGEDLAPESWQTRPGEPKMEDWIIKPNISMGGRGIRHDDGNGLRYGEYYQRKFNKVREFRVHCFLWMDEPVQMIQEKHIENKDQLTWNKKQGGKFRFAYQADMPDFENLKYSEPIAKATREMLTKASVYALKKLKYDFGGLDFGMDKHGNLKIFEVNSRMGLLEQTLFTYKRVFTALKILDIDKYKQERWL
jgi:glutathione synthase/RimK-type ligase-like ATP-grasp enzyme